MTSPTRPPRAPLTERLSQRLRLAGSDRAAADPEERFQRNVTIGFVALIVAAAVIVVVGLAYGFYDSNLKPVANVDGREVGRGEWQDRQRLVAFRAERAETQVRTALSEGSIDEDLASRRLTTISEQRQQTPAVVLEALVDLFYQSQLAAEEGVSLSEAELEAALAADGTAPEARRVRALLIRSPQEDIGLPPTPEGRAEARARAEAALAELEAGADIADLAEEYSPVTAELDGDLGYVTRDVIDAAWAEALFALEEGGRTDIIEGPDGELLIGGVTTIVPERPDPGFLDAVAARVGEDVHRRNVELEATAEKLEAQIVAEAISAEPEQVRLAEIVIEGDTFADPETDEGSIRARHILYAPGDEDEDATPETVPEDDPAWDEAEALADEAAAELRAVEDVDARIEAFASRAEADSDGPTAAVGGDLGFFSRQDMVPEFADALFDAEEFERGDIVGPVRSQFGWHVIMFTEHRAPLAERLAKVEAALAAEGADFAEVAARYSDGPEALQGGETGWHVLDELDELTAIALGATEVGGTTEPIEGDEGWTIYLKQDEGTRPLEPDAQARLAQTAFLDWYEERRFQAESEGRIEIDDSVLGLTAITSLGSGA